MPIDTANKYFVAIQGDQIRILKPPTAPMSKDEALTLAAWIETLGCDDERFNEIREAVRST